MKCWWAATMLLVGLLAATSSADFVILKVDLPKPSSGEATGKGPLGQPMSTTPNPTDTGKGSEAPYQAPGTFVYVLVEVKKAPQENEKFRFFEVERYSEKGTAHPALMIPSHQVGKDVAKLGQTTDRFTEKFKNDRAEKDVAKLLIMAEWALKNGLISTKLPAKGQPTDKFNYTMEKLREADPKNAILAAVDQVKDAYFTKAPTADDPRLSKAGADGSPSLLKHFLDQKYSTKRSSHYTLVNNIPETEDRDQGVSQIRLARMERAYLSFFYWHALQGKVLPMPQYRLLAVLINTRGQPERAKYQENVHEFNAGPLAANAFLARRDNLIVFASVRTDPTFVDFSRDNEKEWANARDWTVNKARLTLQDLLEGNLHGRQDLTMGRIVQFEERKSFFLAAYQARALAQQAMAEEMESAMISHQCARQLLTVTNQLPRSVVVPEWIQYGLGTYYESPHPLLPGIARPNWRQQAVFQFLQESHKWDDPANRELRKEVLLNVVRDHYFRQALTTSQQVADVRNGKMPLSASKVDEETMLKTLQEKNKKDLRLARSTAWALTYYLENRKRDLLARYRTELNRLPRDLEFDEATLEKSFTNALQGESLDALADGWLPYMKQVAGTVDLPAFQQVMVRDLFAEGQPPPAKKEKDDGPRKGP